MANFSNILYKMSEDANKYKISKFNVEKKEKIKDELYFCLTRKYYKNIVNSMLYKASFGEFILYYNFDKEDFKANYPGLGTPKQVCINWLNCLVSLDSKYLDGNNSLIGIDFEVWNNGSFTTKFSWNNPYTYFPNPPPPSPICKL